MSEGEYGQGRASSAAVRRPSRRGRWARGRAPFRIISLAAFTAVFMTVCALASASAEAAPENDDARVAHLHGDRQEQGRL
jgi:hypothetical protein